MTHVAHVVTRFGIVQRIEVDAPDAIAAALQASRGHLRASARPAPAAQVLDALSWRMSRTPLYDSAFGALV